MSDAAPILAVESLSVRRADGAAHTWLSDRSQTTVIEFDKPARNGEHPTMKPVELVIRALQATQPTNMAPK